MPIQTAKIITNGNNQLLAFDEDFLNDKEDTPPQEREF